MKSTLKTVTGVIVHQTNLPAFNEYPQVLLWGNRVLSKVSAGDYRESFFYVVEESLIDRH